MEIKRVQLGEIKRGPIRHESLPPVLLKQIGAIYEVVGKYVCSTLEEWEVGFMYDMHPEREIAVWIRIGLAWQKFHMDYLECQLQSKEDEDELVALLIGISAGVDKKELCQRQVQRFGRVGIDVYEKLLECYQNVGEI